ncbi:DUF1289 domain-containing protein [bacterium]|nr:DUF1289 domain-containing protein [bacterium]
MEPVVPPVESPCQSICKYNVKRYCIGCGRHMSEAGTWFKMTDEEKRAVIAVLPGRKDSLEKGELGGFERGKYEEGSETP